METRIQIFNQDKNLPESWQGCFLSPKNYNNKTISGIKKMRTVKSIFMKLVSMESRPCTHLEGSKFTLEVPFLKSKLGLNLKFMQIIYML